METWKHTAVSLILAALLYKFYSWKVIFIIVGGVLIDIDHYFLFVFKYKKFGLMECYNFFTIEGKKNNWNDFNGDLFVFHTVEFFILMTVLSFYKDFALLFTIGLISHHILDLIFLFTVTKRAVV
ncbi:hypothetical protein HYX00_04345, partial [Candidatus Woesearchaeota archaeon]|nr:hypothetical protein [Candidatus Woesearchaeota archaeon]